MTRNAAPRRPVRRLGASSSVSSVRPSALASSGDQAVEPRAEDAGVGEVMQDAGALSIAESRRRLAEPSPRTEAAEAGATASPDGSRVGTE